MVWSGGGAELASQIPLSTHYPLATPRGSQEAQRAVRSGDPSVAAGMDACVTGLARGHQQMKALLAQQQNSDRELAACRDELRSFKDKKPPNAVVLVRAPFNVDVRHGSWINWSGQSEEHFHSLEGQTVKKFELFLSVDASRTEPRAAGAP
jgi:hypothetical protein